MVLGSVSDAVVSHAHCPVVVVREDNAVTDANKYGPVVVGVDGSDVSRQATEVAFALPFSFDEPDYLQIVGDLAGQLGPALGWTPAIGTP